MKYSCFGKRPGRTGLQMDIFNDPILWPRFCISSYLEKHLNSSWWCPLLVTSRNLLQNICAWMHVLPLHQRHIYTDLPFYHFGVVSRNYLRCCHPGYSPCYCCCCSVTQSCLTLCNPMECSMEASCMEPQGSQASLSFSISWSLLKLMSIRLMMHFNHLILCHPLLHLPWIFPSISLFQWVGCLD